MTGVNFNELLPIITEEIRSGGEVRFKPRGTSMLPYLKEGRDEVILIRPPAKLKKGAILFYRRDDGAFVLHRIVGTEPDGSYILCGDNQFLKEYGIKDRHIVGAAKAVIRKGRAVSSDALSFKLWGFFWPKYKQLYGILYRIYSKLRRHIKR